MVIVVDTNVLSEPVKPTPNEGVVAWLRRHREPKLFTTATVVGELNEGVGMLAPGRKRLELQDDIDLIIATEYDGRILPFDLDAAQAYGFVHELRRIQGRPMQTEDAQIAAVCLVHDAALATRNTRDFEGLGLELIDPWSDGPVEQG
jgi:predicted nucleic acid-binding protein